MRFFRILPILLLGAFLSACSAVTPDVKMNMLLKIKQLDISKAVPISGSDPVGSGSFSAGDGSTLDATGFGLSGQSFSGTDSSTLTFD